MGDLFNCQMFIVGKALLENAFDGIHSISSINEVFALFRVEVIGNFVILVPLLGLTQHGERVVSFNRIQRIVGIFVHIAQPKATCVAFDMVWKLVMIEAIASKTLSFLQCRSQWIIAKSLQPEQE